MPRLLSALAIPMLIALAHVVPPVVQADEPQSGDVRVNPIDGAEMVWIPGGEFLMGSDPEELDRMWARFGWPEKSRQYCAWESPLHRVRLDGFWMYRTEVTNQQFARFTGETGYRTDAERQGHSRAWNAEEQRAQRTEGADWRHPFGPDSSIEGKENGPVVMVTWRDACAYCLWAGLAPPAALLPARPAASVA